MTLIKQTQRCLIVLMYFTLFFLQIYSYTIDADLDKVLDLPGAEKIAIRFNHFSGYLEASETKRIHYWFVESELDPTNDPVVFWTNGGPGCSGLVGFFFEHGPFTVNLKHTLDLNPFSWNKVANMVYIEIPAGVGFSYSPLDSDNSIGDTQTALDNYNVIQSFFHRFPEYMKNDFYIASESYGGHYMPQLAKLIVDNNNLKKYPILNFKGFSVGNPSTNSYSCDFAMYETYAGHQFISKPLWDKFNSKCRKNWSSYCDGLERLMDREFGDRNYYAVDYPKCFDPSGNVFSSMRDHHMQMKHKAKLLKANKMTSNSTTNTSSQISTEAASFYGHYASCGKARSHSYLNRNDVKEALHVQQTIVWTECSDNLNWLYDDGYYESMEPIYTYLLDNFPYLKILVYSGDNDAVCPVVGTQEWIWDLGYILLDENTWQPYYVNNEQAGYLTRWTSGGRKLAFATVHGAGHEVPAYTPDVALDVFKRYLSGDLYN